MCTRQLCPRMHRHGITKITVETRTKHVTFSYTYRVRWIVAVSLLCPTETKQKDTSEAGHILKYRRYPPWEKSVPRVNLPVVSLSLSLRPFGTTESRLLADACLFFRPRLARVAVPADRPTVPRLRSDDVATVFLDKKPRPFPSHPHRVPPLQPKHQ